jgi:hypothetical protein
MPNITTISSDKSKWAIKVGKVIYSLNLLEYLKTLEEEIAYLINTKKMSLGDVNLLCKNASNILQMVL